MTYTLEHLGNEYSIPPERIANRFGRDPSGAYSSATFTAVGKAIGRGMRRGGRRSLRRIPAVFASGWILMRMRWSLGGH
jgi:hypothetical protein